jgi:bla regulator protein blaR1
MIPESLSGVWTTLASAIGNHVWQSTLTAIIAGLLTMLLQKNHARVRYWLWLAASMKFLFPFSLLVSFGRYLSWPGNLTGARTGLYFVVEQVTQPFAQFAVPTIAQTTNSRVVPGLSQLVLGFLVTVWLWGFLAVLCVWYSRWRKISNMVREALPFHGDRELNALRKLERIAGIRRPIEIMLSRGHLEPGIFGIIRPVLIWPEGISERLEDAHLEAILAHEVWHVRRRDNLTAVIHMLVEAFFWFHPLVWWMGTRLVEERERACDEAVLESGTNRRVYAETVLKICEFCVGYSISCVSGVTGADLKKRIIQIMSEGVSHKLDSSRKLVLCVAAILASGIPVSIGLLQPPTSQAGSSNPQSISGRTSVTDWQTAAGGKQSFEFASIRPNTSGSDASSMNIPTGPGELDSTNGGVFAGKNISLVSYIYFAYKLTGTQLQLLIPQLPPWILKDRYDIDARASGHPNKDRMRLMVQTLLEDRFKLAIHFESHQLPVFALLLDNSGKTGPNLQRHTEDPPCSAPSDLTSVHGSSVTIAGGFPLVCGGIVGLPTDPSGRLRAGARNVSIQLLASTVAQMGNLDRAVIDQTALSGNFDFIFQWSPQLNRPLPSGVNGPMEQPSRDFLEDLKRQLGLRLIPQEAPVEIFVIDHAEKLREN